MQVKFRRRDLLYRHLDEIHDPRAAAKRREARVNGESPDATRKLTVPGLPLRTANGNLVGPTLLDMLVRQRWKIIDLPKVTRIALLEALAEKQKELAAQVAAAASNPTSEVKLPPAPPPKSVIAWSVRDLSTLWPRPGQPQSTPRIDEEQPPRELDHPFLTHLASGGRPAHVLVDDDWVAVNKLSTCQINKHVVRVAVGVFGGLDGAHKRIVELASAAWEADLGRALQLWELVRAAPGGVLVEDGDVAALRPICSISQEVERAVMVEVCKWLGIDPSLEVTRERGRPKAAAADQGKVVRIELQPDGSAKGRFIADFEGISAGAQFQDLSLQVLVSTLGALRQQNLEADAGLLEAWLDAAEPDWRKRVVSEDVGDAGALRGPDPYEVLGVDRSAPMPVVAAAYRRAVQSVHPDKSGASAWLLRAVVEAYKQIRAERATGEGSATDEP